MSLEAIKTLYKEEDFKCPITLDWLSPDPYLYPIYGAEDGHNYSMAILDWFDKQDDKDKVKSPLNGNLIGRNLMKNPQPFTSHYLIYIKEMNITIETPHEQIVYNYDKCIILSIRVGNMYGYGVSEDKVRLFIDKVKSQPGYNEILMMLYSNWEHLSNVSDDRLENAINEAVEQFGYTIPGLIILFEKLLI